MPAESSSSQSTTSSLRRRIASRGPQRKLMFLFVNPTSGGNAAAAFTNAGLENALLKDPDCEVVITDIREGESGSKPGFLALKEALDIECEQQKLVYVVACGGDGTVMWTLCEVWAHDIDPLRVAIGVVPYGTGNDFARSLGWNAFNATQPFENSMQLLKVLCQEWLSARIVMHDIWVIRIDLHVNGCFKKIDSTTRCKTILGGETSPVLKKEFNMCNYFSLGVESRIGIGFDRHRTTSQTGNKLVYLNEGVKKTFFKKTKPINAMISNFSVLDGENSTSIFSAKESSSKAKLQEKTSSLIALNIPSFAGGNDVWGACHGKSKLGVLVSNQNENDFGKVCNLRQKMGDGQLEWLSFPNAFALGAETAFKGRARRVWQGTGPFVLNFNELDVETRVYFQVDGEYYTMFCPKMVTLERRCQVKVLANKKASTKLLTAAP